MQCCGEDLIPLQPRAFLVALQSLFQIAFAILGGIALSFLLDPLAFASNQNLVGARLVLTTRHGEVT